VFDFSSLYPTTMRQNNIAPESYLGLKINDKEALLNGIKNIINDTDIVLLNDTVFKNENSQTKQILTNIFNDRKKNKNIGLDFKNQKELLKKYYNNKFK
jgi:DNA polymerase elongation subunit (family B)